MISTNDRGFLYGDGVFESFRTYNGKPFLIKEHLKRLLQGAKVLQIKSLPTIKKLELAVRNEIRKRRFKESYVKVIITRGEAKGHGLDPDKSTGKPTILILVEPQQEKTIKPWKVIISTIKRPDVPSSRIKTLCYVDAILAKIEAKKAGANEAFLLDEKGNLAEGTVSNIFIVKRGIIYTPSLKSPILAGVTRKFVIKLAKAERLKIVEKNISPEELSAADEVFVTMSGAGIVPISKIGKKEIGRGKTGSVAKLLLKLYSQAVG